MGARVALLSGGKDSLYAAMHYWPPDYGLVLVYDFPEPSPHLVNLGLTVETLALTGIPVVVVRLWRGRERRGTVEALRRLGASEVIAGDVYVEDHLKYMEGVAAEAGATLREPLWGRDPEDLALEVFEKGFKAMVIGSWGQLLHWLGGILDSEAAPSFVEEARSLGLDPLGEHGEYHTLVLHSPLHREPLPTPAKAGVEGHGDRWILRLLPAC
ncbi:Dph6-related ATP pyrophosphatase [Stetteria hydrogenophila]